ncbi:Uncharacterised protein [Mycobacteroides abscessus subsp. abscessus]|nr:Uncharacterised protein [Mycobacteroides abscessus subsp. abscessus]
MERGEYEIVLGGVADRDALVEEAGCAEAELEGRGESSLLIGQEKRRLMVIHVDGGEAEAQA